jgi:ABC-type microcin C transport system duplicated ATPase subunit YejF
MAHQVLVLQQGRVVEQGPCPQLLQAPQAPYTRLLVQATL